MMSEFIETNGVKYELLEDQAQTFVLVDKDVVKRKYNDKEKYDWTKDDDEVGYLLSYLFPLRNVETNQELKGIELLKAWGFDPEDIYKSPITEEEKPWYEQESEGTQKVTLYFPDSYLDKLKELGYEENEDLEVVGDEILVYIPYTFDIMELHDESQSEEEFCKKLGFDPEELNFLEVD